MAMSGGINDETEYSRNRYLDGISTPAGRCFYPKHRTIFTCSGVVDVPYRYGGQCHNSYRLVPKTNEQVAVIG